MVLTVASRQLVEHACHVAIRAGVVPGMSLAHARALLGGDLALFTTAHEPDEDQRRLGVLARWAERWSPVVCVDPPDGILIDLTGTEHLFGGEAKMLSRIERSLRRFGLTARLGIASTVGTAWAVARYGPHTRTHVQAGHERDALAPLDIRALRIDAAAIEALHEIGVRHVQEVLSLPRSSLPARYGPQLTRRLDQATGLLAEPIFRLPEKVEFTATLELPGGTTAWESVHAATFETLQRLTTLLESRGQGLRELTAVFDRIDHAQAMLQVRISRASRCPRHLWKLLCPRLERVQLGEGVEKITLTAGDIAPVTQRQTDLLGDHAGRGDDACFAQVLDVIANRIGRGRVLMPLLRQSHRPERIATMVPMADQRPACMPMTTPPHRPSHLIEPPEPIRVMALHPDGPVGRIWRQGVELAVRTCSSPERVGGEWWRSHEPIREYFRVEDEQGRWLWLFRDARRGDWFIHGEWT